MKIGIYNHTFIHGSGIDNVLYEIAKRLSKNHDVEINTFYTDRQDSNLKINLLSKSKSKSVFNAYNPVTAIRTIKSVKNYDIVFTNIYPMNALVSVGRLIYGKKHKHISFFWGAPPSSIIKGFFEKAYHIFLHITEILVPRIGVDVSICPNEFIKNRNKIKNCIILPMHGVDLKRFNEKNIKKESIKKIRQKHKIPEDAIILFTVGRVVPYKGIDLLINVLNKVRQKHKNTYLLVGGSLWNKKYISYLDKIKDENTILLGLIPEQELASYYSLCDIYVSASKWEGQLNAEACASSRPYIAFDTTSHRYTIQNAITGFLVRPYDTEEFAEKVITLIEDKKLRLEMGKNARMWAEKNSDYDLIAKKLETIFLEENQKIK